MARAGKGKARVAQPTPDDEPAIHMLKTVRSTPAKPEVETLCGEIGRPIGYRDAGIRTTGWASHVTCPDCAAHPGVSGMVAPAVSSDV